MLVPLSVSAAICVWVDACSSLISLQLAVKWHRCDGSTLITSAPGRRLLLLLRSDATVFDVCYKQDQGVVLTLGDWWNRRFTSERRRQTATSDMVSNVIYFVPERLMPQWKRQEETLYQKKSDRGGLWMGELASEWAIKRISEGVSEWVREWVSDWVGVYVCMYVYVCVLVCACVYVCALNKHYI